MNITRTMTIAPLAALLLAGCSGARYVDVAPGVTSTAPGQLRPLTVLASADGLDDVPLLDLPPLPKWPRTLRSGGAAYAMLDLAPYVGQLGVLSQYERADAGVGVGVTAGYRTPLAGAKTLGFEFIFETSNHYNAAAGVDATATRLLGAARLNMKMDTKLTPFALVGGGLYQLQYAQLDPRFDLSGLGLLFGGGVDFTPNPKFTLRAELGAHVWAAAEESGDGGVAGTIAINLGAGVSF